VYFLFEYYNPKEYGHLRIKLIVSTNKISSYPQVVCQQKSNVVDLVEYLLYLEF